MLSYFEVNITLQEVCRTHVRHQVSAFEFDLRLVFANLGYWVRSSAAGHGTAVVATRLCAQFGFDELKLQRLEIVVDVDNRRNQRVAEKAGATREGIARHRCKQGSIWRDAVMFSLLPADLDLTPTPV